MLVFGHESLRAVVEMVAPKELVEPLTIAVGRVAKDPSGVAIDNPNVSMRHAEIRFRGAGAFVFDLESKNKTFVGSQQVPPRTEVPLRSDCCVRFGPVSALFVADTADLEQGVGSKERVEAVERLLARGKITERHRHDALAAESARRRPEPGKRLPTAGEVLVLQRAIDPEDWAGAITQVKLSEEVLGEKPRRRLPRWLVLAIVIAAVAAGSLWLGFTLAGRA